MIKRSPAGNYGLVPSSQCMFSGQLDLYLWANVFDSSLMHGNQNHYLVKTRSSEHTLLKGGGAWARVRSG